MDIREDIAILETKIVRLKVEYEQYFMKVLKLEPLKLRDEIERIVLFYSNKPITSTALKFRFNSAVSKYNAYKQYWSRTVRAIEEGKPTGKAAETGAFTGTATNHVNREPIELDHTGHHTQDEQSNRSAPKKETTEMPHEQAEKPTAPSPEEHLANVYKEYVEARKQCNEPTSGLSFDSFAKSVEKSRQQVKDSYKTDNLELKVLIKDGKTKLTIVPKKE
jgi:hypothetical protein